MSRIANVEFKGWAITEAHLLAQLIVPRVFTIEGSAELWQLRRKSLKVFFLLFPTEEEVGHTAVADLMDRGGARLWTIG